MGWSFRKSKSYGPFRINLSKSGIGVSTGVKGARVSLSPHGTYINLGRNGVYYRKRIGSTKSKRSDASSKKTDSTGVYNPTPPSDQIIPLHSEYDFSDAIRVDNTSYEDSVLGHEILKDITISKVMFWVWLILAISSLYFLKMWGIVVALILGILVWFYFRPRVKYDLDDDAYNEWQMFLDNLHYLKKSDRIWLVENAIYNTNRKVNAGTYKTVSKGLATTRFLKPNKSTGFGFKTNAETFIITSPRCRILFIPSGIIVKKSSLTAAYSYEQINMQAYDTHFVEHINPPKDANIINYTWQYVNKDGSPDRRFNNNRQLPVCIYGTLLIEGTKIHIELQTSNSLFHKNVANAYHHYKEYIDSLYAVDKESTYLDHDNQTAESDSDDYTNLPQYDYSPEQQELLGEIYERAGDIGNSLIDCLSEEMHCNVTFIDGQPYNKHVLLLFGADKNITEEVKRVESVLNANIQYKCEMNPISENQFLIHLYMDAYESLDEELPVKAALAVALKKEQAYSITRKTHTELNEYSKDIENVLESGANLFLEDNPHDKKSVDPADDDLYDDLFNVAEDHNHDEGNNATDTSLTDDIMDFFDEA